MYIHVSLSLAVQKCDIESEGQRNTLITVDRAVSWLGKDSVLSYWKLFKRLCCSSSGKIMLAQPQPGPISTLVRGFQSET